MLVFAFGQVVGVENIVGSGGSPQVWQTTAVCSPGAVVAILRQRHFMRTVDAHTKLRFAVRPTLRKMTFARSPLCMPMAWPFVGLTDDELMQVREYIPAWGTSHVRGERIYLRGGPVM